MRFLSVPCIVLVLSVPCIALQVRVTCILASVCLAFPCNVNVPVFVCCLRVAYLLLRALPCLALSLGMCALCLALRCTHTLIHIPLPRASAAFSHPLLGPLSPPLGKCRTTCMCEITPHFVALPLDVHLVFSPTGSRSVDPPHQPHPPQTHLSSPLLGPLHVHLVVPPSVPT